MKKFRVNYKLIIKYLVLLLALTTLAMIFVPAIRYETLATNNVYEFSMWNFMDALFNPETSRNIILSNYLSDHRINAVAQGIAITSILILVFNLLMFIVTLAENNKNNLYIYLNIANFITGLANLIFIIIFSNYLTKITNVAHLGTKGSLLAGGIVSFVCVATTFAIVVIYIIYNMYTKRKKHGKV